MTRSTAATIHRPMSHMFMSAKLDRLVVGSILKQEIEVFLNQCLTGAGVSSCAVYIDRLHILSLESAEVPTTNGRWMGIDNESDQV